MQIKLISLAILSAAFIFFFGCEGSGDGEDSMATHGGHSQNISIYRGAPDIMQNCNPDPEVATCQGWHEPDLTLSVSVNDLQLVNGKRECTDTSENSACCEGLFCYSGDAQNDHVEIQVINDPDTWFSRNWLVTVLDEAHLNQDETTCLVHSTQVKMVPVDLSPELPPLYRPVFDELPDPLKPNTTVGVYIPTRTVSKTNPDTGEVKTFTTELCTIVWEMNGTTYHEHIASSKLLGCVGWAECK